MEPLLTLDRGLGQKFTRNATFWMLLYGLLGATMPLIAKSEAANLERKSVCAEKWL
jgi:hypothetical protein